MTVQQAEWLAGLLDTKPTRGLMVDGESTWAVEASCVLDAFQCIWDATANGRGPPSGPLLRGIHESPGLSGKVLIY